MALEDMKSVYGPTNKKNEIGTGKQVDLLAFEGDNNKGVGHVASTLGPAPPLGKPQEKFGGEGDRSLKKFPGERVLEIK
jgi:hypothetical protein